jgi:small subunit ribosomal protein S3
VGQKTHPIGFRLGIIKDWQATWFASKSRAYRTQLQEDLKIRNSIKSLYPDAGIAQVNIERGSSDLVVTIHTARPGIVIGRGGQRIDELRARLEKGTNRRAKVNVQEIRQPELNAYLVARSVSDQLQRRIAFRRAMRQAVARAMQSGALGIKIVTSGRLGGSEISRREKIMDGRVPLHTLRADIDYGQAEAATAMGRVGVKVWLYRGDILPQPRDDADEVGTLEVTLQANDTGTDQEDELELNQEPSQTQETETQDVTTEES